MPKCRHCGQDITSRKAKKYCSRACRDKAKIKPRPKCARCGTEVKSLQGTYCSPECGHEARRGWVMPTEQRRRISESNVKAKDGRETRRCPVCDLEFEVRRSDPKKFCSAACSRKMRPRRSEASKRRLGEKYRGAGNPAWRGGRTAVNQRDRNTNEYRHWRREVYQRDNYCCAHCGVRGCRSTPLVAHHVLGWADHPASRFDVDNGLTLCHPCHEEAHERKLPLRWAA